MRRIAQASRYSREDDGSWRLVLHVRPDASRRFVQVQRLVAIDWQEEALQPLEIKVRYTMSPAE